MLQRWDLWKIESIENSRTRILQRSLILIIIGGMEPVMKMSSDIVNQLHLQRWKLKALCLLLGVMWGFQKQKMMGFHLKKRWKHWLHSSPISWPRNKSWTRRSKISFLNLVLNCKISYGIYFYGWELRFMIW